MPFDSSGRFLPATALNMQSPTQIQSRAFSQSSPAFQTATTMRPEMSIARSPFMNTSRYSQALNPGVYQPAPDPNPPQQPQPMAPRPPTQGEQAIRPTVGPQGVQTYGMSQLGAPVQQAPVQTGPSPTQMAGRGNAQSVSNYLQALQQSGAAQNNAAMNQPGQLGAGPQGGFRGFGYNPGYGPNYVPQGYLGPMGGGLSYQGNMANTANNYNVGNYAQQGAYGTAARPRSYGGGVTAGGTGGVAGQPQWETPKPWANPYDPEQNPDVWANMSSDEKSAYLGAPREGGWGENKPPQAFSWPSQQGSFYNVSDERAKENITPAQAELEEFMNALGVYSYEYKDKADGEGRYISPMAQEFEKSQLGAQAVVETPEGKKMVNYGRLMGVQTAALALLNHKYNTLEQKFNEAMKTNLKNRKK